MSSISDTDYTAHVDHLIGILAQSHALGRDVDIAMCVSGLEPGRRENRKVRDFVTKTLRIKSSDFDRALHLETIKLELGVLPKTTRQFVEAFAEKKGITARYNGVLRMNEMPYLNRDDGTRDYIARDLWDRPEFKTLIRTSFHRTIGFAEVQQALRVRAAELRLDFTPQMINDASELWYHDVCRARLWQIMANLDYADSQDIRLSGQASLRQLVESCFHHPEGVDFVVAVFNKFIWQVKRKIMDYPIFNHLMPVILGPQEIGKSTLIDKFITPVNELSICTDFRQITDDRNISLWRNFVAVLNEMGYARRSDLETVKNVITTPTLTRRVMRTNTTQEVAQNVTFIGTANATDIGELILDPTGIRRFVSLTMLDRPDWAVINGIDWMNVWQSVDHEAADPMAPFKSLLRSRQEAERRKTPIEEWLSGETAITQLAADRRYRSSSLYTIFREFEDANFPGLIKTSLQIFVREMRKLANRATSRFNYIEDGQYIIWEIKSK